MFWLLARTIPGVEGFVWTIPNDEPRDAGTKVSFAMGTTGESRKALQRLLTNDKYKLSWLTVENGEWVFDLDNLKADFSEQLSSVAWLRGKLSIKPEAEESEYISFYIWPDEVAKSEASSERQGAASSSSTYNFYGNVGAFQTGPGASANIIQNLGSEDKDALLNALNLVRDTLTLVRDLAAEQKDELLQMVDDSVKEVKSTNPNNTKLRTILTAIATTIQTVGSAQPAYQALKTALLPLGITLP